MQDPGREQVLAVCSCRHRLQTQAASQSWEAPKL